MITTMRVLAVLLTCSIFALGQQQKSPSKTSQLRTVPTEAFGTFEGTQKSYVMYVGGYGVPMGQSTWKLHIKLNKIELFQYAGGDTYLYTGGYNVRKTEGSSSGELFCRLKILKDGFADDFETALSFHRDDQGSYSWVKPGGTNGEPEVILKRTED